MKTLTAAILATIIGASAMAREVQVFKPNGETETFKGVEQVDPCEEPNIYALIGREGEVIAVIVNMPMIYRPSSED